MAYYGRTAADKKGQPHLLTAGEDGTVKMWDVRTSGQSVRNLIGHTHVVTSVVASEAGDRVLSGSLDGSVIEWDLTSGKILGPPLILSSSASVANTMSDRSSGPVTSMALVEVENGPTLYTAAKACRGSTVGLVREWNLSRRVETRAFTVEAEVPWCVCVARDLLFVACNDSCTRMWNVKASSRGCDVNLGDGCSLS